VNIGLIAPRPDDGTSLYRAFGPFGYISKDTGYRLISYAEWDWTNITMLNVMVMQRPFTPEHAMVARTCKALKVPLWVDYDDLYSGFPDWVPGSQRVYGSQSIQECVNKCVELADVVTVSTDGLRVMSPKAQVVPNALNTHTWPLTRGTRNPIVTWRGSSGHDGDMFEFLPQMSRLATERPEWKWHYFGRPFYKVGELGAIHPYMDVWSYMQEFCAIGSSIHVVPLVDIPFNRCKSNNAWLEATAAGAVVVAPNWHEWIKPGIINYSDKAGFESAVRHAMSLPADEREALVELSRNYITQHLTLQTVNKQRLAILERFK